MLYPAQLYSSAYALPHAIASERPHLLTSGRRRSRCRPTIKKVVFLLSLIAMHILYIQILQDNLPVLNFHRESVQVDQVRIEL